MLRVRACGMSDVGVIRSHNEDCFDIDPDQRMYVVADGMGGHSHGEIASRIAVEAIREFVSKTADKDSTWPFAGDPKLSRNANRLREAIRVAHERVLRAIRQDGALHGMGTTVVGILLDGDAIAVAHVGDSRAYRYRNGQLELLTQDHTWVNEQVVAGFLSEEQARVHPLKNVVTRALGGDSEVLVDVKEWRVSDGDLFLLCSDGLTTMLSDPEIVERLRSSERLEEVCGRLVRDANARGGYDNVSVVLLKVEEASDDDGDDTATSQIPR
ncbi:MAG: Stp1/IreP family PP2C-type Ser/Thr phosphatase [Thermoanaerobaculia bacterium]